MTWKKSILTGTLFETGLFKDVLLAFISFSFATSATYAVKDMFSSTMVSSGTSYYKINNLAATTTAQTNINKNDQITYWVDNTTTWVIPKAQTAGDGVTYVEAIGLPNKTATVTIYDQIGRVDVTGNSFAGVNEVNVSLGANAVANVEVSYQGPAKGSAGPFGGIFSLEYNNTISSTTCTSPYITDDHDYQLTWTPTTAVSATHTHKEWGYKPEIDDGSGAVRRIDCQFQNGDAAMAIKQLSNNL